MPKLSAEVKKAWAAWSEKAANSWSADLEDTESLREFRQSPDTLAFVMKAFKDLGAMQGYAGAMVFELGSVSKPEDRYFLRIEQAIDTMKDTLNRATEALGMADFFRGKK